MMGDLVFHDAKITVHVYGNPTEILGALSDIADSIHALTQQGVTTMATLDDLVQKVSEQSGTIASLQTFVSGLEQQIADALAGVTLPPAVQDKVDQVFAQLGSNTQAIADAIDNDPNTPATPTPA